MDYYIDTLYLTGNFYKCIHFKGEAGAFLYYDENVNAIVHFQEFYNGEIKDYLNSNSKVEIIFNEQVINSVKLNDMIKLEDSKFCLVNICPGLDKVNIIIVNNYIDDKIKIRHYIYRSYDLYSYSVKVQLSISLYNGLIAMGCIGVYELGNVYGSVIIFSYPNSTDFVIDITDNIKSLTNPIIKFYENCKIENNLFGYIFDGIKIIDISEGFKLLYEDNKLEISIDSIISNDTNVELALTKDIKNKIKGRIQFAMVLTEPEYEIFNQYCTLTPYDLYNSSLIYTGKNIFEKSRA